MSPNNYSRDPYQPVICDRCGDETFGPWVPLRIPLNGYRAYGIRLLCEACWEKRTT